MRVTKYHIITASCFIMSILIGYIYRPIGQDQILGNNRDKTLHYILTLDAKNMTISIYGSGTQNSQGQVRSIYDNQYDLSRTGYIDMYREGDYLYSITHQREKDNKGGSAIHKTIDKILDTSLEKLLKLTSLKSFSSYILSSDWPYEIGQRSRNDISIHLSSYCHRTRYKRHYYNCNISGRIMMPEEYRSIQGTININDDIPIQNNRTKIDLSKALSIEELLHNIR